MKINRLLFSLLSVSLFSACQQLKTLTSRDNSINNSIPKTKPGKDLRFIDNISVTPGEVVTSKHTASTDLSVKKKGSSMMYPQTVTDITPVSAERGNYLQLKFAVLLDASPERLTNTNLFSLIDEWWGTRYCMGGSTKDCVDCSAFSQTIENTVYQANIPRTAQEQYNTCEKVKIEELQEGDLVFFHTQGRSVSHVGIYLVNNKFVHASTSQGVTINDLNESYWKDKFSGAGRIKL